MTAGDYYFLDLFAGSGGFSLGLESAGLTCLGSVEIDPPTRRTLVRNFGESPLRSIRDSDGDICKLVPAHVKRDLHSTGVADLDLLVACPPCQGFSRVGRGKLNSLKGRHGAFHSDPRNSLYKTAIAVLKNLRPKAFIFENVPGMLFMGGRNIAERVCVEADKAGYEVKCALLNAAWYGVPQLRERIIIIGFRKTTGIAPSFPPITHFGEWLKGHASVSDSAAEYWSNKSYFIPFSKMPRSDRLLPLRTVGEALADLPRFTRHLKAQRQGEKYKAIRPAFPPVPMRKLNHRTNIVP